MSLGYCRPAYASSSKPSVDERFLSDPKSCICLALCEGALASIAPPPYRCDAMANACWYGTVINKPSGFTNTGDIYVVPDEDCVVTRFFFVYERQDQVNVKSRDATFVEAINAVMNQFME